MIEIAAERPFKIDRDPVTNAAWARFVREAGARAPACFDGGSPPAGSERMPVTSITADEARQYAAWAGGRLPSTSEWRSSQRALRKLGLVWEWTEFGRPATGAAICGGPFPERREQRWSKEPRGDIGFRVAADAGAASYARVAFARPIFTAWPEGGLGIEDDDDAELVEVRAEASAYSRPRNALAGLDLPRALRQIRGGGAVTRTRGVTLLARPVMAPYKSLLQALGQSQGALPQELVASWGLELFDAAVALRTHGPPTSRLDPQSVGFDVNGRLVVDLLFDHQREFHWLSKAESGGSLQNAGPYRAALFVYELLRAGPVAAGEGAFEVLSGIEAPRPSITSLRPDLPAQLSALLDVWVPYEAELAHLDAGALRRALLACSLPIPARDEAARAIVRDLCADDLKRYEQSAGELRAARVSPAVEVGIEPYARRDLDELWEHAAREEAYNG